MAHLHPELLTIPEVCRILGKSDSAVRRMLQAELLPITRIGGSIRVDAQKLSEWIEAGGRGYGRHRAHFRKSTWPGTDKQRIAQLSGKESRLMLPGLAMPSRIPKLSAWRWDAPTEAGPLF
jgi:excisionase family DNA binding protein